MHHTYIKGNSMISQTGQPESGGLSLLTSCVFVPAGEQFLLSRLLFSYSSCLADTIFC